MYIEIYNKKNQFAKIGRKLFKKMNFKKGHPAFIQIVKLKGSDKFAIIKRTPSETFKTQCNMVERTGERDTPGKFFFTVPSLEYFIAITGKILMNNSPTRNYTVTYKPNTMVSNASGIYYNNYMNNMYSQENAKLVETGASDLMGMYTTESAVKIPMIFTLLPWALLYFITMAVAYVAFRVWKKSNESPEELVGTAVSEEDIPVDDNE